MENEDHLIPVEIFDIYPYPDAQQGLGAPQNFLVLLRAEASQRVVPITIGHFEGQALAMAIRKIDMPRPLPHDLLRHVLEKMGASADKLVIHTLKDDVFHAYLAIQTRAEAFPLDCRPSDGMILATQLGVPLYMSSAVLAEAGRVLEVEEGAGLGEEEECAKISIQHQGGKSMRLPIGEMSELDRLKAHLDWLIAQEAYEQAAKVRDQINKMESEQG